MAPLRYRGDMSNTRMHIDPHNLETPAQFATWRRCQEIMAAGKDPLYYRVTPQHGSERVEMVTPLETGTHPR